MKREIWAFLCAAGVAAGDIVTKQVVQATLELGDRVPLTSFFNLVYHLNPGAAFSSALSTSPSHSFTCATGATH